MTVPIPAAPAPSPSFTADLRARVAALPLEAKVELLTGRTPWKLYPAPQIGLDEVVVSDGPTGIRGTEEDEAHTSISLPSPSALAATWDPDLARRAGSVHAGEARRHGIDVILGPVVNLQRTPVGGRHFECQSEDPLLTGVMAGGIVDGIQAEGVAVCLKHFVANESETLRTEYLARVDERVLREVYLAPFEKLVRESRPWSVMASYNRLDDGVESAPAVAHHRLLTDLLKDEWGYDGLVISDWTAARSTVEPALGGLDLVMPGPAGPWSGGQLLTAVADGRVPEEFVDDKVLRLLLLASRVGKLDGYPEPLPAAEVTEPDRLIRHLAGRVVVVLSDTDGSLPVADPAAVGSIALIGPNAVEPFIQGGGSALVRPSSVVSAVDAFAEAFPAATITLSRGAHSRVTPPAALPGRVTDPVTGQPGAFVQFLDAAGAVVGERRGAEADIYWRRGMPGEATRMRVSADLVLDEPGEHWVGFGTPGAHRLWVDGELVSHDETELSGGDVLMRTLHHAPPFHGATVTGPGTARLEAEAQLYADPAWDSFARVVVHHLPPEPEPAELLAEAVDAARAADLVVVVVGTNDQVESEGFDRPDLDLPGEQDALVAAVLEARPDAVVVVNAGAPVLLPWLEQARTVLWAWFGGQEGLRGVADVLAGFTEPTGRLPWTLPARLSDVPVPHARPVGDDLVVDYAEGLDVGYRGWLRSGRTPARPFGFGLGWTTWSYGTPRTRVDEDGEVVVEVEVTNTGARPGRETVQVYLEGPGAGPVRPVRWLAGFGQVECAPGATATARVTLQQRAFEVWDTASQGWTLPPGDYLVVVGRDVADERGSALLRR